ncbi:hypothetical protein AGMMS50212_01170 [Spirochaetia bacterium]|nr:hypothetical protein AGMMS50212_01170 [Spirochaetia bacterium]
MRYESPLLVNAHRGFSVTYNGKTLLSTVDPIRQAERAAERSLPLKDRTLYFCPSPLLGYGLAILLDNLPPASAVICVEADKALAKLSNENIKIPSGEKIRVIHSEDAMQLCDFVNQTWGRRFFRRVEEIRLGGGRQLWTEKYDDMLETLRRAIAIDWSNAMTLTRLGRLYMRNAVKNLPLLGSAESVEKIDFGHRNVFVAGAGPSLDEAVFHLGSCLKGENRCPVICVDTALPPLMAHGIIPDIVVALEAQHWNLRDFVGINGKKPSLAMDFSSLPAVKRCFNESVYIFWTEWTPLRFFCRLKERNLLPLELPALGSVGLSAVYLALRLTKGKILSAGIDFSFTIDKYHCKESPGYKENMRRTNRFVSPLPFAPSFRKGVSPAISKSGGSVRTDPAMKNYRSLFEEEFAATGRVFDMEGSGLTLGLTTLPYSYALQLLEATDPTKPENGTSKTEPPMDKAQVLRTFIKDEIAHLSELRGILTKEITAPPDRLNFLLDELDYLWAHFPDCAGAGGRRPSPENTGFLKRVRAEIDPFLRLFTRTANA